jgi:hypothetical protein
MSVTRRGLRLAAASAAALPARRCRSSALAAVEMKFTPGRVTPSTPVNCVFHRLWGVAVESLVRLLRPATLTSRRLMSRSVAGVVYVPEVRHAPRSRGWAGGDR